MSQLPAEQAIQRFKENEERVDKFVNQPGTYQTNTTPPANVETLSSFIERKDQEITNRYAAMNNRGNWVTGTGYNPLDLYVYGGVVYLVLLAHTSTTVAADVAASKAQVFQGVTPLSLETALNNERSRFGRVGYNSLPRLIQRMKDYLSAPSSPLTVVGFGSSVGVGATLPDAATQAPSAWFKTKLQQALDPAGLRTWAVANRSVNGSIVQEFQTAWANMVSAGITPTAPVLLCYGMNDGQAAQFNSGETFPSVYTMHARAIATIRASGTDAVLCTTPHPHTGRYTPSLGGANQLYPTAITAPTNEQISPPASSSFVSGDFCGNGINVTADVRYLLVNEAIRKAAADHGCALIDVERYWFLAVQKYGNDALFNAAEVVHPNLLGHQQSYQKAIEDFCYSIANQSHQEGHSPSEYGRKILNPPQENTIPGATVDIYPQYDNTEKPWSVKARTGAADGNGVKAPEEAWYIDPANGDLVSPRRRIPKTGSKETYTDGVYTASIDRSGQYNILAGNTFTYTLPDNSAGEIRINALQSGVAISQVYHNIFSTHNGTATLGASPLQIGAGTEFTVTVSGLVVTVTVTYSGTNIRFKLDAW